MKRKITDKTYEFVPENRWMWEHKWHNMLDALASGSSIEEYLQTLN
jgi:hypothetical protein